MRIDTTKRISHRDLEKAIHFFAEPCTCSFHVEQSVEQAILSLQSEEPHKRSEYFYIVDSEGYLEGLITLTDLLYNPPHTQLREILDLDVLKVYDDEPLEKGLRLLSLHQLLILPVVNRENRLSGVLEVIPHTNGRFHPPKKIHYKYLKEDLFQFIGFSIEHRKWHSPWTEYRLRMPWLLCNLVGGLICAAISQFFELALERYVILAFFIPLVLTLSESVSIQSMTLSLRFLHLRRIHWKRIWQRSYVETKSSLMLGLTSALLVTCFYFAWSTQIGPIIGIGSSVVLAMMISALFGALFPIFLHTLHLDPKVAAGPVVLMVADIITILIYLTINTLILI
jgi:magnesium transporter